MLRKDVRSFANRLSKQIDKIANVGIKIERYFYDSYQKCANLEFTEDAIAAFKSVEKLPGGSAIEIFRDIDKHLDTFYVFLNRWEASRNVDKKTIKLGKSMHNELLKFKDYIMDTPLDMMEDVKKTVVQNRLGRY